MKRLFYFLLLLLPTYTFAQSVGGVPLSEIKEEYIQLVGTGRFLSTKVSVEIDFGQENKNGTRKDTQLRDGADKLIVFNSMIDALNFMTSNGYEFVQAYAFSTGNQNVYHYLLRRKK